MQLTPREKDKLLVSMAANVARRRLERGVRLNHPEAIALITDYVVEGARDGRSVAELMRDGAGVISRDQVMEGHDSYTDISIRQDRYGKRGVRRGRAFSLYHDV